LEQGELQQQQMDMQVERVVILPSRTSLRRAAVVVLQRIKQPPKLGVLAVLDIMARAAPVMKVETMPFLV
jgi:hypothetical protein